VTKIRKVVLKVALILVLILAALFYRSCVSHKLNEEVFYDDGNIELKVVRYFRNWPFSYRGIIYQVGCRSRNTATQPGYTIQDPGWRDIGTYVGMHLGPEPSLSTLVDAAKGGYRVTESDTMIYIASLETAPGVAATWDACRTFSYWQLKSIPDDYVKQDGYQACLREHPSWSTTCKKWLFRGEYSPVFHDLEAKGSGYASFVVSSTAFLETDSYRIETHDYGKTWNLHPIIKAAAE
jgi:hypothetical protein